MKSKSKNLFLWSSLGSIFVGATVLGARRRKADAPALDLVCRKIPGRCRTIIIWTEPAEVQFEEGRFLCREKYLLQQTSFKVWSVLDLAEGGRRPNPEGAAVYHVTCIQELEDPAGIRVDIRVGAETRFYATVGVTRPDGSHSEKNCLARGALLQLKKCNVGGASNGVETGEIHLSQAPILQYRFEYAAESQKTS